VSEDRVVQWSRESQDAYRKRLAQYLDPPKDRSRREDLEYDLRCAERDVVEHPLPHQDENGIYLRRTGLITADEARAAATPEGLQQLDLLGMPKVPRVRDDFRLIPESEWMDLIQQRRQDEAFLRPLVEGFTLDQMSVGSCASEGYGGGTIAREAVQGNELVEKLNAYGLYRYVNGGRDGGSSLSDNMAAGAKYGVPSERVWPRSNGWRTPLTDEAKQDALRHRIDEFWRVGNKAEFGTALLLGMAVYAGYSGHAWYAVDPLDTLRFVWHNSWGKDWADGGFSTLRYDSVAWYYGCWAFRTSRRPLELPPIDI